MYSQWLRNCNQYERTGDDIFNFLDYVILVSENYFYEADPHKPSHIEWMFEDGQWKPVRAGG